MFRHTSMWLPLVVVLAGTSILIASAEAEYDPVYGFTDISCTYNLEYFINMEAMDDYSSANNGWEYNSYIKVSDPNNCVEVVRVEGQQDEDEEEEEESTPGGGTGAPPISANPADYFSETDAEELKSCWEEKVAEANLEGWDSDAEDIASWFVTWQNVRGTAAGYGHTEGSTTGHGDGLISLNVSIFTDMIANESWGTFDHLAAFAQMHEKVHVFQFLRESGDDDGITLPSPYELHEMEVQANLFSYAWWEAIFPDPPPFKRLSDREIYRYKSKEGEYKGRFKKKREEYRKLEDKRAKGTLTDADETRMKDLENWFNDPSRLPKNKKNDDYNPNMEFDCE